MDAKKRITSVSDEARVGPTTDREVELLTQLVELQAQIESVGDCLKVIQDKMNLLSMQEKNVSMALEELKASTETTH